MSSFVNGNSGDFVRKSLIGLGIILLFVGVVISSEYNSAVEEPPEDKLVKEVNNLPVGKWEISAQFNKSEKLTVFFSTPDLENVPAFTRFYASIVDPMGGRTNFTIDFSKKPSGLDVNFNVTSNDGGLIVDKPIEGIVGVTSYNGLYTVHIYTLFTSLYYPPDGTLPSLDLYKVVKKTDYPYRNILPIGIGLILVGVSLSVWAAKYSSKSRKKRERK